MKRGTSDQRRWRHQDIDLTGEEIERLLPLVRRARTHLGQLRQGNSENRPTELFDSLRESVQEIASSRGFANCQVGWKSDGTTVSVWAQWQEEL